MQLKTLFLFKEKYYQDRPLAKPSIEDNKYVLSEVEADEIVKYLESGLTLLEFVSRLEDPYDGEFTPFVIKTDGIYVWDTVIISWVKKYKVRLPESFITYMQKRNYQLIDHSLIPKGLSDFLKQSEKIFC